MKRFIILLLCTLIYPLMLKAQTTYNLSDSNGDWNTPGTWAPAGVPGPGDYVIIDNTTVEINSSQHTIAGFTIIDGAILFKGTDPTLTITDSSVWYDGELDGGNGANGGNTVNSNFIIPPGAVLIIDTDATPESHRVYEGLTLTNQGTIRHIGSSNLGIRGLSVLKNEGLYDVVSDADFSGESFSGGTFLNTGTFRKSGGSDISSFNLWWNFQNDGGTIDAQSGSIHFICLGTFNGGNYIAADNAAIDFRSSTQIFKGTLSGSPVGAVRLSGSTINIDSSGVVLDFQGTGFQFSKGVISGGGTLTIPEGSLLRLVNDPVDPTSFQNLIGGTTLLNLGTIQQESNTTVGIRGNSIVDNRSLFEIVTDADFSGGPGSGGTFLNTGAFRKSGGNDVTRMNIWWKFFNQSGGVIDAASGELEFSMSNINFENSEGAIITGTDTIDVTSAFTNDGIIAPGSSVGVLTYVGNFLPSATAVLNIELEGLISDGEYERLNVIGSANLDGTLKVSVINGFIPAKGDSFVVLTTTGSVSDSFMTIDAQSGLYLTVKINSNNVTVLVDSVGNITSVDGETGTGIVTSYELSQNYPNPFNPSTAIQFAILQSSFVTLEVFNALGERISVLVSEKLNAGKHNYEWDASGFTSGIYIYRITATPNGGQAGNFIEAKKMILMK